jgi:hypothetical protein
LSSALSRRLVVVRAGDTSLHPHWLDGSEAATFDLAVCYYGDNPQAYADCMVRYAVKGGKWDGLHAFFAANPRLLAQYDFIWLPDDDIAATTASINRLFDLTEKHALDLTQPSLTWDSYYSHFITLHNPRFELRWTNFVEIMAPVFSTDFLRRILPVFAGRRFGTGLDYVWSRWMPDPYCRTAIIDSAAVRHTRPVGKGNLSLGADDARGAEARALLQAYGLPRPSRAVYAGIDMQGRVLKRGVRLGVELCLGWMPLCRLTYDTGQFPEKIGRFVERVGKIALRRVDITPLPISPAQTGS